MAQRGINKVILIGNLGQDPDVRYTQAGDPIATLSLATSEAWKDKQGEPQERTEWHRVVLFGKIADIAKQYLTKGAKVYVEGQLRTRKWQDQGGQDRYTTEVQVGVTGILQMLTSKRDGDPVQTGTGAPPERQAAGQGANPTAPRQAPNAPPLYDDDIPF